MKRAWNHLAVTGTALAVAALAVPPTRLLIWNASASLPTGLYLLRSGAPLAAATCNSSPACSGRG